MLRRVPILDRPEERSQFRTVESHLQQLREFQSSIAPKNDRNWSTRSLLYCSESSNPRSPRRTIAMNRLELIESRVQVPILDRPEERSQSDSIHHRRWTLMRSNPRSPRRTIAMVGFKNSSSWSQSSNPRSPRRTIAIRLRFCPAWIAFKFQSSIAPKNDRNLRF